MCEEKGKINKDDFNKTNLKRSFIRINISIILLIFFIVISILSLSLKLLPILTVEYKRLN